MAFKLANRDFRPAGVLQAPSAEVGRVVGVDAWKRKVKYGHPEALHRENLSSERE